MSYLGLGTNEYGVEVTRHRCDTCGKEFTVCPAVSPEVHDQWNVCLADDCDSYEPTRDAELYLGLGLVEKVPAEPTMTADTDPALDEYRDIIRFLRENAEDLGLGSTGSPNGDDRV